MENSLLSRIFGKLVVAILALALVDLLYLNWWVIQSQKSKESRFLTKSKGQSEEQRVVEAIPSPSPDIGASPTPSPLSSPVAETKTVETKTVVEKETQTIVQTAQKEIFIPIGTGSTKSASYVDLSGLEVTIDTGKYSAIESVVFEASIWVQDGNGKMFAQLYNVTDKHPVWNSEISTNLANGTLTTSAKITLDNGSRTYQVQAKTNLTEFAAHVESARIKITLK